MHICMREATSTYMNAVASVIASEKMDLVFFSRENDAVCNELDQSSLPTASSTCAFVLSSSRFITSTHS